MFPFPTSVQASLTESSGASPFQQVYSRKQTTLLSHNICAKFEQFDIASFQYISCYFLDLSTSKRSS